MRHPFIGHAVTALAAAAITATITIGSVTQAAPSQQAPSQQATPTSTPRPTRVPEPSKPFYLVIKRVAQPDGGMSCKLTLDATISNAIKRGTEGNRDDLCVTLVNLTVDGTENLPTELGDLLIGMYPATDENNNPLPFSTYLPLVTK